MKKIYIIAVILFLISLNDYAQKCLWAFNGSNVNTLGGEAKAKSTSVDRDGNLYVTGNFSSHSINIGGIVLTNNSYINSKIFIAKFDSTGNVIWAKNIENSHVYANTWYESTSIKVDKFGNIYLSGTFSGDTIAFDSITFHLNGKTRIFLAKLNNSGNFIWVKDFNCNNVVTLNGQDPAPIDIDTLGNIYMAGVYKDSLVSYPVQAGSINLGPVDVAWGDVDIFVAKFNSNGDPLWAKKAGSKGDERAYAISCDAVGNVYITGNFSDSTCSFGNITLNNTTSNSIFIVKYDTNGNEIWARNSKGSYQPQEPYTIVRSIKADVFGNIYITGNFQGKKIIFGTDSLINTAPPNNALKSLPFLVKYNSFGTAIWAKNEVVFQDPNTYIFGINVDISGNIYTVGYTFDSNSSGNNVAYCSFAKKYSASGALLWYFSTSNNWNQSGKSVSPDKYGNVYLLGNFSSGPLSFGNNIVITKQGTGSNPSDVFIAKLEAGSSTVWPGDANHDYVVNNHDLLPIGLYYSQTGTPRASISNNYQGFSSTDWGVAQSNTEDIKHVNCNGDSIINSDDTLAVNLNFNLAHAFSPPSSNTIDYDTRQPRYFSIIAPSGFHNAGDWIDAEIWLGDSLTPINNLYGVSFNLFYDASLVQTGTESLTYPNSWLATPGTDAIKIAKIDPLVSTTYGAITRIDHANRSGYGKIANFRFQIKPSLIGPHILHLSFSNYIANDSTGVRQLFNLQNDSILINQLSTNISDNNPATFTISPNPFTSETTITFNREQKHSTLKIIDVLGKVLKTINFSGQQLLIEKEEMRRGIYFLQITDENKIVTTEKIIIQ